MKWLAALAVTLFCSGYWICEYFYPDNLIAWWDLRIFINSVIFSLVFFIGFELTKGMTKAIFLVGMVFCGGDIIDRYIFSINSFQMNDILLYLFAAYYLTKTYAREIKSNTQ